MNRRNQVTLLAILVVAAVATLLFVILPAIAQQAPDQVVEALYTFDVRLTNGRGAWQITDVACSVK